MILRSKERFMTPWDWRKAAGGWPMRNDPDYRNFHAYDVNDNAACDPMIGLISSAEELNEGSTLCHECVAIVKAEPHGRDVKVCAK